MKIQITENEKLQIAEMIAEGKPMTYIANKLGMRLKDVREYRIEAGICKPHLIRKTTEEIIGYMVRSCKTFDEIQRYTRIPRDDLAAYINANFDAIMDAAPKGDKNSAYLTLVHQWHWVNPRTDKKVKKHKYRVVVKGEKGRLRTPYRSDRVFH